MISCNEVTYLTQDEKKEIEDTIQQVLNNSYSDIKVHGLTAEFKYLDSSNEFFWVPPGYSRPLSYDSVAAVLNRSAPALKAVENTFDTLHIIPLSRSIAIYTARIHSIVTDTQNQVTITNLVETGVLIKRPDGWKLHNGQTAIIDDRGNTGNNP